MQITRDIIYIGVDDREIDLFEGQYSVPNGMAYNSYAIVDEKLAVMDSVEARFQDEWLSGINAAAGGRQPDYLIVQHMEPDHSGSIMAFANAYPDAKIVATARAFMMMKNFFGTEFVERRLVVGEGDRLPLGEHELTFFCAPMVHWPEVMVSYDSRDGVLFSADAFGKFGTHDTQEEWLDEARRYYISIVGKYGIQTQALLKKARAVDVKYICPLHGPTLSGDIGKYIGYYDIWSSYGVESEGVVIAYTSIYGNTKKAVLELSSELKANGVKVTVYDLARCDMSMAVADAFRYGTLVLATTTYNGDIFPFMKEFIDHLLERGFRNRKVALMENGSWSPMAAKIMRGMLEGCRGMEFAENTVRILSALNDDCRAAITALAKELSGGNENTTIDQIRRDTGMKYVCDICGWEYNEAEGAPDHGIAPGTKFEDLPEDFVCPLCGVGKDNFSKAE